MDTPWREWPAARLVVPFIAGICFAIYTNPWQPWSIGATLLCAVVCLLLSLWPVTNRSPRWQWVISVAGICSLLCGGVAAVHYQTAVHQSSHYSHFLQSADSLTVTIQRPPTLTPTSYRLQVSVDTVYVYGHATPVDGQCLLYLRGQKLADTLTYGTSLLIPNRLQSIPPPQNPAVFNYQRYLSHRSIYHQAFLSDSLCKVTATNRGNRLMRIIFQARHYLLQALETQVADKESVAVASALLVGYKELLDDEITQAYATTGAMHVLAVSGLHVGIIFAVLQLLLRWMPEKRRALRVLKPAILLTGIWSFAAITGLSPSVVRAATMFSFVVAGGTIKRPVSIYSSIATSALLLLLLNPYLITEVGFQLSYSAVLGIVYFQPRLVKLFFFDNRVLQWLWEISCVSIAAQLATFPIGIYYFHQFPTYFMVSNLFVIPAAAVILYTGLLLFATAWLPVVSEYIGLFLNTFIRLLNQIILYLETLPMALISPINQELYQIILLYAGIGAVTYWLVTLRRAGLFMSLAVFTLLAASWNIQRLHTIPQQITTVYHMRGHTAIGIMAGTTGQLMLDSALIGAEGKISYQIAPHFNDKRCRIDTMISLQGMATHPYGWQWQQAGKEWLLLTDLPDTSKYLQVDYLILSANRAITPVAIGKAIAFRQMVLDGSHSFGSQRFWQQVAADSGWTIHNTTTMGALVVESGS